MTAPSIKEALEYERRIRTKIYDSNILTFAEWVYLVGVFQAANEHEECPALAAFQPDGERREAIARALAEKWPGDYMQGDDECEREPNALAYETADLILEPGLVQNEAGIRADEREKCAKIAENHSFLRDIEWWMTSTKKDVSAESCHSVASAIRSARDGGAET